ncbi:TetR family transcriptional regulator [Microvirga tunisiensis]|uniref:TetR family transcriptional regulator n=2 Tax=Pannonibacter tanglangensis TaxID=2750084 RepID=A0A7X5F602_9HYPH|nr:MULTISPECIES: TetR/AcrR family transcriptional regulator [unclassified Pannonibacter]NBN65835.1 TetR family transcriptional regulator [Pannonibacter sp. XCT-34]NBN80353.1 TetR family transcriptional regulator [Pannonibacter sp. XCT-53]
MSDFQGVSISDQKRQQILEAAIAEFQERGFAGASMDRISDRATVSKRTVYNHFASKDVLFRAIIDCLADRMTAALDVVYVPGEDLRDQLTRLAWAEGNLLVDPCFMRMARMLMGETIRHPVLAAEFAQRVDKMRAFGAFMDAAFADGALVAGTPELAATQFMALIKARGFYPYLLTGGAPDRDLMQAIVADAVAFMIKAFARAD